MSKSSSSIVLIRGGEGIQEPNDSLPASIAAMLEIDSTVPLRNRGLVPDCKRIFDLDFYRPFDITYYYEAELAIQADKRFAKKYENLKARIFQAYPLEANNWDEIKIQRIDAHGAGALWIQGVLKVFLALIGRAYEATGRDKEMPFRRTSEKKGKYVGEIRVSMLTDLIQALVELGPDEVGLVCGALGGTGPSVSAVLGDVLADLKYNIVRVQLVAMPDSFMVNDHTPSEVADRLAAVIKVLQPLALYAGLGQSGVFWHFLGKHMRTVGERFSNVVAKKMAFGAAPAITIIGVPLREDLEDRWLVGQTALNRLQWDGENGARDRLMQAKGSGLITFETVPYQDDLGVRIRVESPKRLLLWQWELLLPALAAARAGIGRFTLPVEITTGGLFNKRKEMREVKVESVPLMDNLMKRAGVTDIARLEEATAFWALTKVERLMLERCRQMTFEKAFETIAAEWVQSSREILGDLVFKSPLFPPQSEVFEDPAKAFFMWGQVNLGESVLADTVCGYFARVDRSREEAERLRVEEEKRQVEVMERVAQQLASIEREE